MWRVEIRRHTSHKVEKVIGPYPTERMASTADRGVNRNLDHARFYTIIVKSPTVPAPPDNK